MTNYQPGEIVLIFVPFTSGSGGKTRPALVVADTGDADVVVARITTQSTMCNEDILLSDWSAAGLLASSVVRVHKLATMEKSLIHRKLGQLTPADHLRVGNALKGLFAGW